MRQFLWVFLMSVVFCAPLHNNPGQTPAAEHANPFRPVFPTIFLVSPNSWTLEMSEKKYGVPVVGYLKGFTWKNSPVILYADLIKTQYSFDSFTQIDTLSKAKKFKTIHFKNKVVHLPGSRPFVTTLWSLPGVVYEYNTYFSVGKGRIISVVMSSKDPKLLGSYYGEYQKILSNVARAEESFTTAR